MSRTNGIIHVDLSSMTDLISKHTTRNELKILHINMICYYRTYFSHLLELIDRRKLHRDYIQVAIVKMHAELFCFLVVYKVCL